MKSPNFIQDQPVRVGSRGSALALAQTRLAIERFQTVHPRQPTELVIVRTEGDVDRTSPLTDIGGRGVFTSAFEARILDGTIDAAVHSAKDLPTALHPAAPIVAMPDRDDPRDVLVSRHNTTLELLPANPTIGTSSRRREAQIVRLRPDARIINIRGNIDTRLRKAHELEYDAIVLAAAGVRRLGWDHRVSQYFSVDEIVPSPGQGAIAIQAMEGSAAASWFASTDDIEVSSAVSLERAFLERVGMGCQLPIGAYASRNNDGFRILAMLADPTGGRMAFADEALTPGDESRHVADIAVRLMAKVGASRGGGSWQGWSGSTGDLAGIRVVVTRPRRQAGQLMTVLAGRGADPLSLPTIRVEPLRDTAALDGALNAATQGTFDWIAFTSANAVDVVVNRLFDLGVDVGLLSEVKVAAIGPATAMAAKQAGLNVAFIADSANAGAMAAQLIDTIDPGATVLYPRSVIGRDALPQALRQAGAEVVEIDAYETLPEPDIDPLVLDQIRQGEIDAITFNSPSSIHNLISLLGEDRAVVDRIPTICAGPVTAKAAREAGLIVAAISADPGATAIADAMAAHWCQREGLANTFSDGRVMAVEQPVKWSIE